ncbi:MAG: hypothetical protein IKN79_04305 [Eubacterium sp.]|nr:hypothetical protein [Eubacterium sp.]
MAKIMKYEILRNKVTMVALTGVLLGAEAVFLLGVILKKDSTVSLGSVFLILGAGAAFFTVWLQGLTGFRKDLNEKTGYMVFLTPVSPYRIVIGKLLVALGELIFASGLMALLGTIDIKLLYARYETPMMIIEMVAKFLGVTTSEVWAGFIVMVITSMLSTLTLYAVAYLFSAMWASRFGTGESGRAGNIILVVMVVLIYYLIVLNLPTLSSSLRNPVVRNFVQKLPRYIFYVIGTVVCTWGTGYLLNRKISL